MNGYFITGIAAGVLGIALGAVPTHVVDANHYGAQLAREKAAHAADIARVNAEAAQQLREALANQQAAEGRVATVEQQFNDEVAKHAKDNLDYRAQLASGAQRLRVRVTHCAVGPTADQSAAASGRADDSAAFAELDPTVATGVVQVAADDQAEIDKLKALQAYVRALQDQGYIGR